jgi:hypothetical protein
MVHFQSLIIVYLALFHTELSISVKIQSFTIKDDNIISKNLIGNV